MTRATPKQKKLVKAMVANVGKRGKSKPMKALMKEAGYSDAMAKNPKKALSSPVFQDLLDKAGATDEAHALVFKLGLFRGIKFDNKNPGKVVSDGGNSATMVRHHYLKTGLILKKHLNTAGEDLAEAFGQMVQFQLPPQKELPK